MIIPATKTTTTLHTNEAPASTTLGGATRRAFVKADEVSLRALRTALDDLATRLRAVLADEGRKKGDLPRNLAALRDSPVRVPRSTLPEQFDVARTISNTMRNVRSPEAGLLQQALLLSSQARDSVALMTFERAKGELVAGRIGARITAVTKSLADVEGFKALIDARLAGTLSA